MTRSSQDEDVAKRAALLTRSFRNKVPVATRPLQIRFIVEGTELGEGACRGARVSRTRTALHEWAYLHLQVGSENALGGRRPDQIALRALRRCPRTDLSQASCRGGGPWSKKSDTCFATHEAPAKHEPASKVNGPRDLHGQHGSHWRNPDVSVDGLSVYLCVRDSRVPFSVRTGSQTREAPPRTGRSSPARRSDNLHTILSIHPDLTKDPLQTGEAYVEASAPSAWSSWQSKRVPPTLVPWIKIRHRRVIPWRSQWGPEAKGVVPVRIDDALVRAPQCRIILFRSKCSSKHTTKPWLDTSRYSASLHPPNAEGKETRPRS